MDFKRVDCLKEKGFEGFKTIEELFSDYSGIPKVKGVYVVLRDDSKEPEFVQKGVGGFLKGKDPNVPIERLKAKWVNKTVVLYIGKAGSASSIRPSSQNLQRRLRLYLKFGQGLPVAHYGGRYIWQLKDYKNLIVCWKTLFKSQSDPRGYEKELLDKFFSSYGKLPFANLMH